MPIIKSAIKRVRQTKTRMLRNRVTKSKFRTLMKEFKVLVDAKKIEEAAKLFPQVQKEIDMAAKKGILHKNNAARKKSSLSKFIRDANVSGVKSVSKTPVKKEGGANTRKKEEGKRKKG